MYIFILIKYSWIILNINKLQELAKNGDKSAEEQLFKLLTERFTYFTTLRIGDSDDAVEIVQDTLMTIAGKYRGIDFETSFTSWSYRVLENHIFNYRRSLMRRRRGLEQAARLQVEKQNVTSDPTLKRRLLECLQKVNEQNIRHARILNLKYQGFKFKDICEKLKLSRNGAYILLSRARQALKECLDRS
jgi:RNA polymerase sigma-70 factor (ECF subfamily)